MNDAFIPPSLEQMDGVGPAALGEYVVGEPLAFVDPGVVVEDYLVFYGLFVDTGTDPIDPTDPVPTTVPNALIVYHEDRILRVYK